MQGSLVLINEEELSKHTFVKKKHFDDCQVYEICKYIPILLSDKALKFLKNFFPH